MSKDISLDVTNELDVESAKQYRKHNKQQNDDDSDIGTPKAKSTPQKSSMKKGEPTTVVVAQTYLNRNRLPKIAICPAKYTPMVYTFRVPAYDAQNVSLGKAQRPPFGLLLDNAIAVVWCLFSKTTCPKPLGICQLQWALSFLETIVNRRGEHPKDVGICVTAITDQLIDLYSDLVNELQAPHKPKGKKQKENKDEVIEEAEETSRSSHGKDETVGNLPLSESYMDRIVGRMPFSPNYMDIVNTSRKSTTAAYGMNTTKSGKSINTQSRDQLVNFLSSWKQEQIGKIQSELQRLHSIENFIGNCEKGTFSGPLGEKEMHVLLAEKNKRNKTA